MLVIGSAGSSSGMGVRADTGGRITPEPSSRRLVCDRARVVGRDKGWGRCPDCGNLWMMHRRVTSV